MVFLPEFKLEKLKGLEGLTLKEIEYTPRGEIGHITLEHYPSLVDKISGKQKYYLMKFNKLKC